MGIGTSWKGLKPEHNRLCPHLTRRWVTFIQILSEGADMTRQIEKDFKKYGTFTRTKLIVRGIENAHFPGIGPALILAAKGNPRF